MYTYIKIELHTLDFEKPDKSEIIVNNFLCLLETNCLINFHIVIEIIIFDYIQLNTFIKFISVI